MKNHWLLVGLWSYAKSKSFVFDVNNIKKHVFLMKFSKILTPGSLEEKFFILKNKLKLKHQKCDVW